MNVHVLGEWAMLTLFRRQPGYDRQVAMQRAIQELQDAQAVFDSADPVFADVEWYRVQAAQARLRLLVQEAQMQKEVVGGPTA